MSINIESKELDQIDISFKSDNELGELIEKGEVTITLTKLINGRPINSEVRYMHGTFFGMFPLNSRVHTWKCTSINDAHKVFVEEVCRHAGFEVIYI